jgi:aspartate/methionine/tyrosine aminotransferase
MTDLKVASEQEIRIRTYTSYKEIFASAPIRLMSRTVSTMRSLGYNDLASAIGDLDWQTVPVDDPEDPMLRHDWSTILNDAFGHTDSWLRQLSANPMGYNLDSVGCQPVTGAWSKLWSHQLGIDFENAPQKKPQIFVFHGGNQAVSTAFMAAAEAHRERVGTGTPATVLVHLPTFPCPMDQIAMLGMQALLLPPVDPSMDPSAADIDQIPEGTDIDAVYVMPINNPTGRTVPPQQLREFIDAVLERWPHAGIILDSVYVRLHPRYCELLTWYNRDPRYREAVIFIDSLSKTHGVTGLRAGALLTASKRFAPGIIRYAQNILAGPSNAMQAVMLALLAPYLSGDQELIEQRIRLQLRIGRHLQRRRRLLLKQAFSRFGHLLADEQPMLPDPVEFDWEGSMYANLLLSEQCLEIAEQHGVPPTVAFYLETGIGGVPLNGFCGNPNLDRHGLVVNADDPKLVELQKRTTRYVRLSFGMTPPPRESRA